MVRLHNERRRIMEQEQCSSKLEQRYIDLKNVQYTDITLWRLTALELLSLATLEKSPRKRALALQSLAEHSFYVSNLEDSLNYCLELINLCEINGYKNSLAQANNIIGAILVKQNNEVKALEYFLLALEYLEGSHNYLLRSSIYVNIADLHSILKDYQEAIACYEIAEKNLLEEFAMRGRNQRNIEQQIFEIHYLSKRCFTYCAMGEVMKAIQLRDQLLGMEQNELPLIKELLTIIQSKLGYKLGEFEQFNRDIDDVMQGARNTQIFGLLYEEYLDLLEKLITRADYARVERMLEIVKPTQVIVKSISLMLHYYQVIIPYYRITKKEELNEVYHNFYHLMKQRELKINESRILNIKSKISLEKEVEKQLKNEKEIHRLKLLSEHDALTGLANRYLLNEYCEQLFEENKRKKTEFGIIVVDIDFFKHFNDYFGHLEGDRCIKEIAEVVQRESKEQFCARFGGDEFFVITSGLKEEELYHMSDAIREGTLDLKFSQAKEVEMRYVTVSQGICSSIPMNEQTYSDFIHSADMALYRGKKTERNSIFIGSLS